VAVSVNETVAPATTAPLGSVIVPATVPEEIDCAQMGRLQARQTTKRRNSARFMLHMCITFLLDEGNKAIREPEAGRRVFIILEASA
jgi:hypothetical protein